MEKKKLRWPFVAGGAFFVLLLPSLMIQTFKIPAGSMIPTLEIGDHIAINKLKRAPSRGDIIVFEYPRDPSKDFVKRVVAVGGDMIELRDNRMILNGHEIERVAKPGPCEYRDYDEVSEETIRRTCDAFDETLDGKRYTVYQAKGDVARSWPVKAVPPDHYFVMGDNRDNSSDSRHWGFVPAKNVKGTFIGVWLRSPPK
jgi:signal peptidase I